MYEAIAVKGATALTTKFKIPKREIAISIMNESNYTLTNVTMYFNGTGVIPSSPNIVPSTKPSNV